MNISRRGLLGSTTFILIGCQTTGGSVDVKQAIVDAAIIIGTASPPAGIAGAYATLKILYPGIIPAATDKQIMAALDRGPGYLAQLSPIADAAQNATNLAGIVSITGQVLNLVSGILTPLVAGDPNLAPVLLGFQAAAFLLPFIQSTISQIAPSKAVGAPAIPAMFRGAKLDRDSARAALRVR